jgi:hypothetical protein
VSSLDAGEVRRALTDPRRLCSALGLFDGYRPQRSGRGGWLVRCPNHREQTPSCSVHLGPDGTVAVRCHGCGWSGDALTLVAKVLGLDSSRNDFPRVVEEAARIANVTPGTSSAPRRAAQAPAPLAYPDGAEVTALWAAAGPVDGDAEARAYLEGRGIDPGMVALYDLARVLPRGARAPSWARCRGRPWPESGHRLLFPMVDPSGEVRSLRAGLLAAPTDDTPKRCAPAGKAMAGLVMACPVARWMLATGEAPSWFGAQPLDVVIAEGEPDWLTWAASVSDASEHPPAVLGVVACAWAEAFAVCIPDGARVIIRTHRDAAGDRYAAEIKRTLADRLVAFFDFPRPSKVTDGEEAA